MSDKSTIEFFETLQENRSMWLEEFGLREKDVMVDDVGEFILTESDNGSPSEDGYVVKKTKVYLPDEVTVKAFDKYGV